MNNTIITIGRQFGSGGREIAKKVAQTLGYAYYDKELLADTAQQSGLNVSRIGLDRAAEIIVELSGK